MDTFLNFPRPTLRTLGILGLIGHPRDVARFGGTCKRAYDAASDTNNGVWTLVWKGLGQKPLGTVSYTHLTLPTKA